ncbi:unnamed protein product [Calicophoron daubneyi]|uniref:Tegument antigen n=1 Tax=Calicophoron daubneyi TaxID=300641 RepID=A0AAV2T4H0_CALDB
MDDFLYLFFKIDTNLDEVITTAELTNYVNKHHLDPYMVQRWKTMFTDSVTGNITLAKFCEVLGIKPEQAIFHRESVTVQHTPPPTRERRMTDVEEIASDMPAERKVRISDEARRLQQRAPTLKNDEIAKQLKTFLDKEFGRAWHVVIVPDSFWMSFSHNARSSYQFRIRNLTYLVWCTPCE